jgi:hypothetical protein
MTLSTLAVGLGLIFSLPNVFGILKPAAFGDAVRRFPRSVLWGYVLMAIGTVWFLRNLHLESISDFAAYKRLMVLGFGTVGVLACIYVKDFLAVRGLSVVLLLLAKLTLDTARWHDSQWRLVLAAWAYLWIVAAIWFAVSPWRLRDLLDWSTASIQRIRMGSALRLAFGLFVIILGLTVLR